jgi:hypothetical protein
MLKGSDENDLWQWREAEEPIIIAGFEGGAPGLWFSLTFLILGVLILMSASAPSMWKPTSDGSGPAGMGSLFFGGVLTALGGWFLKTKWRIEQLTPLSTLCKRLGMNAAQVQQFAAKRRVKPRYIVNGLEYYASSDFLDAESLLRASDAPEERTENLLRPAGAGEVAAQELLRVPEETATVSAADVMQTPEEAVTIHTR